MHRRPLGRGRILAILSAIVIAGACVLPWYTIGGDESSLPAQSTNALGSLAGLIIFLDALAVLALVAFPYAAREVPADVDRWPTYLVLTAVSATAFLAMVLTALGGEFIIDGLRPDRAPGIWIAAAGLIALGRATFEIHAEQGAR